MVAFLSYLSERLIDDALGLAERAFDRHRRGDAAALCVTTDVGLDRVLEPLRGARAVRIRAAARPSLRSHLDMHGQFVEVLRAA